MILVGRITNKIKERYDSISHRWVLKKRAGCKNDKYLTTELVQQGKLFKALNSCLCFGNK